MYFNHKNKRTSLCGQHRGGQFKGLSKWTEPGVLLTVNVEKIHTLVSESDYGNVSYGYHSVHGDIEIACW